MTLHRMEEADEKLHRTEEETDEKLHRTEEGMRGYIDK
jgi:hypothetical protein